MNPAVLLALVILATARLTRLVVRDHLTERPRRWAQAHVSESVAYLLTCPWCMSIWLGAPTAFAAVWWQTNRAVIVTLVALAASHATGLLSLLDPDDELPEPDESSHAA